MTDLEAFLLLEQALTWWDNVAVVYDASQCIPTYPKGTDHVSVAYRGEIPEWVTKARAETTPGPYPWGTLVVEQCKDPEHRAICPACSGPKGWRP